MTMTEVVNDNTIKKDEEASSKCLICGLALDVLDTTQPLDSIYNKWKDEFREKRYQDVRQIVEDRLSPQARHC